MTLSHPVAFSSFKATRKSHLYLCLLILLAGDINLNPGPVPSLNLAHLNTRSVASVTNDLNKPAALLDFISDNKIDILTLSETWLQPDSQPSILNSITPDNYSLLHAPRLSGRGGGIAVLYRSFLRLTSVPIPTFNSFEALCTRLTISSTSFTILTIYRPFTSSSLFIDEFSTLLEDLISSPSELIILGDFNFHVDQPSSPTVAPFLTLLETFDLIQHVSFPTHLQSHTLDLLITRTSATFISSLSFTDPQYLITLLFLLPSLFLFIKGSLVLKNTLDLFAPLITQNFPMTFALPVCILLQQLH